MNPLDENQIYYDPSSVSSRDIGTRYGLFWALAAIVFGLVTYLLGWADPSNASTTTGLISGVISFGIGIAMVVLPIQQAKKALGGYITFGKAFSTGFWSILVYAAITAVWTFVFMSFIAPEIGELTASTMVEQWEEQGMSDEQIDGMSWMVDLFSNPLTLAIFGTISGIVIWCIIDLILSAILKKNPPMA